MKYSPEKGMLARSRAGRDKDTFYIIVDTGGTKNGIDYVYVADGLKHKINSPKKKSLKHLFLSPRKDDALQKMLNDGKILDDAQIQAAIGRLIEK